MKTFQTIAREIGKSKMITIPFDIVKQLYIEKGDIIELNIINMEKRIRSYKCKKDDYEFSSSDAIPYCPICAESDETIIVNA